MKVIKSLSKLIRNLTLRKKLVISFLLITMIPFMILGIIAYYIAYNNLIDNYKSQNSKMIYQFGLSLDWYFKDVEDMSRSLVTNESIRYFLETDKNDKNFSYYKNQASNRLLELLNEREDISSIYMLIDGGGHIQKGDNGLGIGLSIRSMPEYKIAENKDGSFVWLGLRETMNSNYSREKLYIIGVRILKNFRTGENVGILVINMKEDYISSKLSAIKQNKDNKLYIIDKHNVITASENNSKLLTKSEYNLPAADSQNKKTIKHTVNTDNKSNIVFFYHSEHTGWYVVSDISKKSIINGISNIVLTISIIGIITFLVCFGTGILISKSITKPIYRLISVMDNVESGNLDLKSDIDSKDEIGTLSDTFNGMTEKLKYSFEKIEQQNIKLKKLDKLKDEFLANTTHELKTPLNGIIGLTESLIDGVAGELPYKVKDNLFMIVHSGKRLAHLINDILDFSRLKENEISLKLKTLDLRIVVNMVIALSKELLMGKPVELINEIEPNFPLIKADEGRLNQVLLNLVSNAIKFTNEGKIIVSAEVRNDKAVINISDTGIGIPKEGIKKVFKSFEQIDASISREYGGTGLGLTISQQLVELHGGEIWVESEENKGSKFSFTIPLCFDDELQENKKQKIFGKDKTKFIEHHFETQINSIVNNNNKASQAKVLVVDDEPVNLQVLINQLSLAGYCVMTAHNGEEALTLFETSQELPEIVLMDIMMPKMSGYEVTKALRKKYSLSDLPIIMLTAKNQISDLVTGLECGANDYLSKPFNKIELLSRVNTLLSLKRTNEKQKELLIFEQELKIAHRIQQSIIPKSFSKNKHINIAALFIPMMEVAGDFYDYHMPNEKEMGILIADISGHGVSAALIASMVKIAFSLVRNFIHKPSEVMSELNKMLIGKFDNQYLTANYIYLNFEEKILINANGGHPPLLIQKADSKELITLKPSGKILGWFDNITNETRKINLDEGDRIFLYTDCIEESINENEEEYGEERLFAFIQKNKNTEITKLKTKMIEELKNWTNKKYFDDDLTFIILEIMD